MALYIRNNDFGYYLNCVSVNASGPMLSMEIESNSSSHPMQTAEVQIPYSFVRLTMKSTSRNPLGFGSGGS